MQHHTGVNNGQMARTGQDGTSKHERWDDRLKFRRIVSFTFSPFAFSASHPTAVCGDLDVITAGVKHVRALQGVTDASGTLEAERLKK